MSFNIETKTSNYDIQWNSSNQDAIGEEESIMISEAG